MSTVTVIVVSPDIRSERRIDLHLTIKQLKDKLETVTGISSGSQRIFAYDSEDASSVSTSSGIELGDDERPVGYYGITNGKVLKIIDTSPPGASLTGQFTDVSQVEKFELSEQEYATRRDTLLAYKQNNKLGRFADAPKSSSVPDISPSSQIQILEAYPLGTRCEVDHSDGSNDTLKKRGTVKFVGTTSFGTGAGMWIGIEYDEPVGKNDGSVQGKRYFSCNPSYGGFVRPEKVRVGDFPPLDLGLEEEEI